MALKRKRSESELSYSSSFSSPTRPGSAFDFSSMAVTSPSNALRAPSHLPCRTMKRLRNGRPSDEEVHQHTLDLLYSAPVRHHDHDEIDSPHRRLFEPSSAPQQTPSTNSSQRSLHSFWNLPAPSSASSPSSSCSTPSQTPFTAVSPPTRCDDCGVGLGSIDGDDAMDLDGAGEDSCCGACGRAVCFRCSVSNLGAQRRCLVCAGRKTGAGWTGGVGVL